jgi:metal-dependent amidase/aminoacylase/carboxypeptidase family protein
MVNDASLVRRLKGVWESSMTVGSVIDEPPTGMGGEDFPYFTIDPQISSAFWRVGGTPAEDFERAAAGGAPVPSHHSPLFKIDPEPAVRAGVESTVLALLDLMKP